MASGVQVGHVHLPKESSIIDWLDVMPTSLNDVLLAASFRRYQFGQPRHLLEPVATIRPNTSRASDYRHCAQGQLTSRSFDEPNGFLHRNGRRFDCRSIIECIEWLIEGLCSHRPVVANAHKSL